MKISVIGAVRAINIIADIPPIIRQKTNIPWFILSRVIDNEKDGRRSQLQKTSCPPEMRMIPATLMMANQRGTTNSSA
jgi:hypothetical protein